MKTTLLLALLLTSIQLQAQSLATGLNTQTFEICLAFDVVAAKHLTIDDFSVNVSNGGTNRTVYIWKRKTYGSYLPVINDLSAWEQAGTAVVASPGGLATLGLSLGIWVPAGETQAFMITPGLKCRTTQPAGALRAQNADLSIYYGHGGPIPFNPYVPDRGFSGTIHYTLAPPHTFDLKMEALLSPQTDDQDCGILSFSEVVTVQMRNTGSQTLAAGTLLQIDLIVDGVNITTDLPLTAAAVAPGAVFSHTFSQTVDFSQGLSHNVVVSLLNLGDMEPSNDVLNTTITAGGQARVMGLPYFENFDSSHNPNFGVNIVPPPGWYQEPNDWNGFESQLTLRVSNGSFTPGIGHGWEFPTPPNSPPVSAFLSPQYAANVSTPSPAVLELRSPCLDLSAAFNPRLSFWLTWSNKKNYLAIDVLDTTTGIRHVDVMSPIIAPVSTFVQEKRVVDLSAFAGSTIRLIFRFEIAVATFGFPLLDDIVIVDGPLTPGQSPQPGFAEFASEISLNVHNDQPSVMSGGPYYIKKSAGETFHLDFSGQPSQPIWLLTGPLNPQAATFPIVGTMDLGGLPDANGIPLGVSIIADGTQPGLGSLFNLDPTGQLSLSFTIPTLPFGLYAPFQAAIMTGGANGSWVALSNTIALEIQ